MIDQQARPVATPTFDCLICKQTDFTPHAHFLPWEQGQVLDASLLFGASKPSSWAEAQGRARP